MKSAQMAIRMVLAAGTVTIVAGGCRVDQKKEVQQYRNVLDLKGAQTLPTAWPAGQVLTLREAMVLANQQNERLSIQGEGYLQSMIARKRAVSLFLPTASLNGATGLAENVGGSASANHTTDAWLSGQVNLFNGFRDVARLKAADLTIAQQRYLLLNLQEVLLADTVRTYFQVLRTAAQIEDLRSSVAAQEARVQDVTQRQKAGVARVLDVAQSQSQLSETKVALLSAQIAQGNARQALVLLTNAQVADAPLEEAKALPEQIGDLASLQAKALLHRQDFLAAQEARDAARQRVEVAVGQYYPSASLNLRYFLYRETQPDDRAWESVLQVNLPIFSAGLIEADVREAWSAFRQASLTLSLLRRQVLQEVNVVSSTYVESFPRLAERDVQVQAAKLALDQADALYHAGLGTNLERITAQAQYLNAELSLTSEKYNQYVNATDLLLAVGGVREWLEAGLSAPATQPARASALPTTQATPLPVAP